MSWGHSANAEWGDHLLEADALSVAAALDVEHAVVGPAVLVVSNEGPPGICRQSSLARTCTMPRTVSQTVRLAYEVHSTSILLALRATHTQSISSALCPDPLCVGDHNQQRKNEQ